MTPAVIYCRISKDDQDDRLGVQRQERMCRKLARDRGLDVVDVLTDNDLSAFKGKRRPAFEAVVDLLKKHPIFNASLDEATKEIVFKDYVNLGIAVST